MELFLLGSKLKERYSNKRFQNKVIFSKNIDEILDSLEDSKSLNNCTLLIYTEATDSLSSILIDLENRAPSLLEFIPVVVFAPSKFIPDVANDLAKKVDGLLYEFPEPEIVESLAHFYRNKKNVYIEKEKRRIVESVLYRMVAENLKKPEIREVIPAALYLGIDNLGYIIAATDEILDILGYSRDEVIGRHFSEIVSGGELEGVKRIFTERRTGKRSSRGVKVKLRKKDGTTTEVIVDASGIHIPSVEIYPQKDPYRVYIGTLCYSKIEDIYGKSKGFEQVKLLYEAFKSTNTPIIVYDPEEKYIYPNYAFLKYTGYELEEIYNKDPSYFEASKPENREVSLFKRYLKDFDQKKHLVFRTEIMSKNGEKKCCEVSADYFESLGKKLIYLAFDDLSETLKFIDDLQSLIKLAWEVSRSYTIEKLAEKTINILASIIKPPFLFIYLENELELSSHNLMVWSDNNIKWLDFYGEEIPEILRKGIRDAIEREHPQYLPLQDENVLLDDLLMENNQKATLVVFPFGSNGEMLGVTGLILPETFRFTVHEIRILELTSSIIGTSMKKYYLEKEKEQYLLHLEELVKERTRELEDYVYIISHDLKSPLHAARGFMDMIRTRFGEFIKTDDDRYIVQRALENVKQAINMIDGLLVLSRIGTQELKIEKVNLKQIIEDYFIQRKALDKGNVEINYGIRGEFPEIMADKAQIIQLFNNIFDNSVKYRRGNNVKIDINGFAKNNMVVVSIRDNGVGINSEDISRVFDVFYRGVGSSTTVEGRGLGLTIVKKILDRQGGNVEIESEESQGTTVTISIPFKWKH